jgi:hypothetical protein
VTYVFEVDAEKLKQRIKHSLMHPKTCADL